LASLFHEFVRVLKSIRWFAFLNVLLASLLVGAIVHELINVVLLAHPMKICLHIGELPSIVSICCLTEEEVKHWWLGSELFPLLGQFVIMLLWVLACRNQYIKQHRHKEN
jgi:hypothetical protein